MNTIYTTSGTISSQNQITLPKAVRDALNVQAGDAIGWLVDQGKVILTSLYRKKSDPVAQLAGSAHELYKKYGGADAIIKQNQKDWET